MTGFPLKIVTPDGIQFDGTAQQLNVRTTTGDVAILARHINYVAPLGMGEASVLVDGEKRYAACIGGMVSVMDGIVTLMPTTFEWSEKINVDRVLRSIQKAEKVLEKKDSSDLEISLAEARLKRALIRKSVASHNRK